MSLDMEIRCLEPKQRYTSGEVISGIVLMNVNTELKIDSLELCCQCVSETSITAQGAVNKAHKQHYFKSLNRDFGRVFAVGQYEYPFSFTLPKSADLPETYSSGHVTLNGSRDNKSGTGNVVWEIKASVPRFKIFDISLEVKQQFWFVPSKGTDYAFKTDHSFSPMPIRLGSKLFKSKTRQPNLYLRVKTPRSGIPQGPSPTGIEVLLYSEVESTLYLQELVISLEAKTQFLAKTHVFEDISCTGILHIQPNLPLGLDPLDLDMCQDTPFSLPVMFYGSFDSSLIKLSYELVVEVAIGTLRGDSRVKRKQVKIPVIVRPLAALGYDEDDGKDYDHSELKFRDSGYDNEVEFDLDVPPIHISEPLIQFEEKPSKMNYSFSSSSLDELWEPEYEDEIANLFKERGKLQQLEQLS